MRAVARDRTGGRDRRPRSPGPASRSRPSTTSSASLDPETLLIADAERPLGIAGVMGGAVIGGVRVDQGRRRRVGHLRSDQHPPDGLPVRPSLRGKPPVREGPGTPPGAPRRRPNGATDRRVGGRERGVGRRRHEPDRAAAGARRVPAVASQPAARRGPAERRRSGTSWRGSASRPRPRRSGTRVVVSSEPMPLEVDPGDAETLIATVPSWRRDLAIEADITEEVARVQGYDVVPELLPHTPMPHHRHSPLSATAHAPRNAWPAPDSPRP